MDAQIRESRKKLAIAVKASGTSLTGIFGAGPVIAATVMATWPGSASLRPGSLIAGAVARAVNVQVAIGGGAAIMLAYSAWAFWKFSEIKRV